MGAKKIIQVSQGIPTNLLSEPREVNNVHYQFRMCSFPVLIYGTLTVLIIGVGAIIWFHKKRVYTHDTDTNKLPLKVHPLLHHVQLKENDPAYILTVPE